jgi:hypothetical protein
MHGKSIAWVRDRCRLQGAYRPLLYAVATHAGKHHADCTASAATLARASGLSARHVKRLLPELVAMGVLEQLDSGSGRRAACHRIAPPLWVEGIAGASGVVEGEASASDVVEGTIASGDTMSPLSTSAIGAEPRSGDIGNPVVVTSGFRSGDIDESRFSGLSRENSTPAGQQEKYVEEKREEKYVQSKPLSSARKNALDPSVLNLDHLRAVLEHDPGAMLDPGTVWSPAMITLSDGAVLPNPQRVREWLESPPAWRPGSPSSTAPARTGPAASVLDRRQ